MIQEMTLLEYIIISQEVTHIILYSNNHTKMVWAWVITAQQCALIQYYYYKLYSNYNNVIFTNMSIFDKSLIGICIVRKG